MVDINLVIVAQVPSGCRRSHDIEFSISSEAENLSNPQNIPLPDLLYRVYGLIQHPRCQNGKLWKQLWIRMTLHTPISRFILNIADNQQDWTPSAVCLPRLLEMPWCHKLMQSPMVCGHLRHLPLQKTAVIPSPSPSPLTALILFLFLSLIFLCIFSCNDYDNAPIASITHLPPPLGWHQPSLEFFFLFILFCLSFILIIILLLKLLWHASCVHHPPHSPSTISPSRRIFFLVRLSLTFLSFLLLIFLLNLLQELR